VLRVSGEQEMGVPPLRLPDPLHLPSLASLSQYEAVALFVERAVAAQPAFAVTNENAPAVAGICSQLDGLPLAIELAAARVRLLTPAAILDRLERRLSLLTGGGRDLPDRQRTLRGAIDWSYDLLDATERRLLGRLAVFAGGWTFEAAEAVCNPGEELGRDTLDGLASLSDKSLIRADIEDEARFSMLHVVREFAAEKLDADPDAETIRNRHARHVLGLVEDAEPQLIGPEIRLWQHRLRAEEENLRAALRWTSERGDAEAGLRLAGSLWHFWHYWGTMREGRRWLEEMLRLPGPSMSERRAGALTGLGNVVYWQGDMDRAETLYGEALAIHRELGDESRIAGTLHDLAWTAVARGDGALGSARAQEAAERYERAGDAAGAERIATWLVSGAFLMGIEGDAEKAIDAISRRIETERRNGRAHDAAEAQGTLALVLLRAGETRRAAEAARVALQQWIEIGNVGRYAVYVKVIAALELAHGQPGRAARLASAAIRFSEELGGSLPDALTRLGDPIEMARAFLEPDEHERAVREGRSMTPEQAVAYALEDAGQAASAAS
jgi:predicted ATPase